MYSGEDMLRHVRKAPREVPEFSMRNEFSILLADADLDFHDAVSDFLKNTGTHLVACCSGKEALASIQGQKPDLVFLSDTLKDLACHSLCRKLKMDRSSSSIPLVMVLSSGRANDREYSLEAGCSDVLVKPVERADFFSSLKKFVNLEKRFNPRFRSQSEISCSLQYSISHDCKVYDISAGGIFLEACPPLPLNTLVSLDFDLPESAIRISCKGRVAWINHPIALSKIDFPFGVGMEFAEMSEDTAEALADYLNGNRRIRQTHKQRS